LEHSISYKTSLWPGKNESKQELVFNIFVRVGVVWESKNQRPPLDTKGVRNLIFSTLIPLLCFKN